VIFLLNHVIILVIPHIGVRCLWLSKNLRKFVSIWLWFNRKL